MWNFLACSTLIGSYFRAECFRSQDLEWMEACKRLKKKRLLVFMVSFFLVKGNYLVTFKIIRHEKTGGFHQGSYKVG